MINVFIMFHKYGGWSSSPGLFLAFHTMIRIRESELPFTQVKMTVHPILCLHFHGFHFLFPCISSCLLTAYVCTFKAHNRPPPLWSLSWTLTISSFLLTNQREYLVLTSILFCNLLHISYFQLDCKLIFYRLNEQVNEFLNKQTKRKKGRQCLGKEWAAAYLYPTDPKKILKA